MSLCLYNKKQEDIEYSDEKNEEIEKKQIFICIVNEKEINS